MDLAAVREVAQPGGRGARVQAVDQADGVGQPGLLDQQSLEQVDAGVEVVVDVVDDRPRPARSSR